MRALQIVNWRHAKDALDVLSMVIVAIAGLLLIFTQLEARWAPASTRRARIEDATGLRIATGLVRNVKGSGPLALIEFSDYQCPFCTRYALDVAPQVDSSFVKRGTLRRVQLNFPLERIHSRARRAAEAAECAGRHEGTRLAVTATPTFFVGTVTDDGSVDIARRIIGVPSFADLREVIDAVGILRGTKQ